MSTQSGAYEGELRLSEDFGSGALARQFTKAALERSGYQGRHDDVVLVVSELVANALLHGTGAPLLRVAAAPSRLRIEVMDRNPVLPTVRSPGPTGGGLGLTVVELLAAEWGADQRDGGKVVWCEMAPTLRPVVAAIAP